MFESLKMTRTSPNLKLVIVNIIIQPQKQPLKPQLPRLPIAQNLKKSMGTPEIGITVARKMARTGKRLPRLKRLMWKNKMGANCAVANVAKAAENCAEGFDVFGGNVGLFEKCEKLGGDCELF